MNLEIINKEKSHVDADMFDIGGFFRFFAEAVRLHKTLVFVTCLITLIAVTWYVYVWPPIYSVEAQLVAERELDPSRDAFYASWQVFRKEDPRDEVKLFTAGPVLRQLVEKNHLTYNDVYHPFLSHASYLWQKSWLGTQYTNLKSRLGIQPEVSKEQQEAGETMEGLKAGISIVAEGDSNIATVTVKGPTRRVSDIANSLIDSYLQNRKQRHQEEARAAFDVLTTDAQTAGAELDLIEKRRESFANQHGLLMDFQKQTQDVKELTENEASIATHKSKIAALEGSVREVDARMAEETPEKVLSSITEVNAVAEAAKMKRLELQTLLIGLRDKYREDSPEVQETIASLAKLDALIAKEPDHIDRSVTKGVNQVRQQLQVSRLELMSSLEGERSALAMEEQNTSQLRQGLSTLPEVTGTAQDLQREYDVAKEKYQRLLLLRMEAQVSASSIEAAPGSVRVIDYAMPPAGKYWPRLKYLYPGALLAGLILGMLAAVIRTLTAGRFLRSDVDRGRITSPVFATLAVGGTHRTLTVVHRQSEPVELPANVPPKDNDRAKGAGV